MNPEPALQAVPFVPSQAVVGTAAVEPGTFPLRGTLEVCFYALLLVQILRIWTIRYYPTQDGPSHLYNASVLANYNRVPAYRDFYSIRIRPGNVLAQALQWGLLKTAGELAAEKVILTLYILLLPLSFRALLRTAGGDHTPFALFGLLLMPNFFFYMGFWNFCLSVPLLFFALAWYRRRGAEWRPVPALVFALLSLLTYAAHALSWAVLVLAVALESGAALARAWRAGELRKASGNIAAGLAAAGLPALLALAYMGSAGGSLVSGGTLRQRIWPLYSAAFLRGLGADRWLSIGFVCLVTALVIAAAYRRRGGRLRGPDTFLLVAMACAALSVWGPRIPGVAYVGDRFALCAWAFGVIWLSSIRWPSCVRTLAGISITALAVAEPALHRPLETAWNRRLCEYAQARKFIAPGSTILAVQMETRFPDADPMLHAAGLAALGGAIDLRNYEASSPHFSLQFRPGRTPPNSFGKPDAAAVINPEFSVSRYESAIGRPVDYVLVYGGAGVPELQLYAGQFAGYSQVYVSRPSASVRLYERRIGGAIGATN